MTYTLAQPTGIFALLSINLLMENHRLTQALNTDPLTGAGSPYAYHERRRSLSGSESFIVIDLDRFKSINDTYGHQFGDFVLAKVGETISRCVRADHDKCRLYRPGGDEFVVILNAPVNAAQQVAQRIEQAIAALVVGPVSVSASVGVGESVGEADEKMYRDKDVSG